MNRKAISPLVATILLIAFALLIGMATMNWGKAYASKVEDSKVQDERFGSAVVIGFDKLDTPLKELQIKYITGRITLEEYIVQEKQLLDNS